MVRKTGAHEIEIGRCDGFEEATLRGRKAGRRKGALSREDDGAGFRLSDQTSFGSKTAEAFGVRNHL